MHKVVDISYFSLIKQILITHCMYVHWNSFNLRIQSTNVEQQRNLLRYSLENSTPVEYSSQYFAAGMHVIAINIVSGTQFSQD